MNRIARTLLVLAPLLVFAVGCSKELVCSTGENVCGGQCANLQSDTSNCGACGQACGASQSCQNGLCCQGDLCPAAIYVACFASGEVVGATANPIAPVGTPATVPNVTSLAWSATTNLLWGVPGYGESAAYAVATSLSGVANVTAVQIPIVSSADLVYVAANDSLLYVSDDDANSVVVIGPTSTGYGVLGEVTGLPQGFSPYGIAFSATTGYVALQNYVTGASQVAAFNTATQAVTTSIDLSSLGSVAGSAQADRMLVVGNRLYVTLWNLNPATYTPAGDGLLAVIDTTSNALAAGVKNPLDLGSGCQDPYGLAVNGSTVYVTCGFLSPSGSVQGTGIVPVDISGSTPAVLPIISTEGLTPEPYFAPGPIAFCGGLGYIGDQQFGYMLKLDPTASPSLTASAVPLCSPAAGQPSGSYVGLNDIACAH